jgi:hypothetical protein
MAGRRTTRRTTQRISQINVKKLAQDARKPAGFILGIMAGKAIGKMIDKNETVQGLIGFEGKKMLKPLGIGAAGLVVNQVVKNSDVKNVGMGMATYGGILAVEAATGKPVLNGLQGMDDYQQLPDYDTSVAALPAKENLDVAREISKILDDPDGSMEGLDDDISYTAGIEGGDINYTAGYDDEAQVIDITEGFDDEEEDEFEELDMTA